MELPDPTTSIILFALTFCVGYITLLLAYHFAGRLPEWLCLDTFDKTIITFMVGGIITTSSFFTLNAPINSLLYATDSQSTNLALSQLSTWLVRNFGITVVIEVSLITVVAVAIVLFLDRNNTERIDYSV